MTERTGNGWQTPDHILDLVRSVGPIMLDPCTYRDNPTGAELIRTIKCDPDGLATDWAGLVARSSCSRHGLVYVNPPYGRGLMAGWADKITAEAAKGCQIVALTRGDTSTKWAQQLLRSASKVCFPPRIKFKGATGSPNFANLIFYFGPNTGRFVVAFDSLGVIR